MSTWAKKQRLQERDTGLLSDTPRDKAFCSTALFTSTCPRHATYKAACVLSLIPSMCDVFQRWSQQHDKDVCLTLLLEHLCSIPPKGCSLCWVHLPPHGQRWLFCWPLSGKLSGKDKLQSPITICIPSAKLKDNHLLRGHPSGSYRAGHVPFCCKERPCKGPSWKQPFCSFWFCSHY